MKPLLLKGHERAITTVTFNHDGDLLFSCSKDKRITVWSATDGERLGTYDGHGGAVRSACVTRDSRWVFTCGEEGNVMGWDVETGAPLQKDEAGRPAPAFQFPGGLPAMAMSEGDHMLAVAQNSLGQRVSTAIFVLQIDRETATLTESLKIDDPECNRMKVHAIAWLPLNCGILVAYDSALLRLYHPETGAVVGSWRDHAKYVTSITFNASKTMMLTTAKDKTAKLWEVRPDVDEPRNTVLRVKKTYKSDVPLNAGAISPWKRHVFVGGGEEARDAAKSGQSMVKFSMRIFHTVFGGEIGRVKGHFGTMNALAISPDGRCYASGAEDGYVRLHHLDDSYTALDESKDMWHPDLEKWAAAADGADSDEGEA